MSIEVYLEPRSAGGEDGSEPEQTQQGPLTRRGFGKHLLLGASALGVLLATGKRDEALAAPTTDPWRLGGNSISTNGTNFLGTTNSAPIIFKTAGVERMRISPTGNIGIGTINPVAKLLVDVAAGEAIFGRRTATAGTAAAVRGDTNSTAAEASAVLGKVLSTNPGSNSAAVRGDNSGTSYNGIGVRGSHAGSGYGVYGSASVSGYGVYGSGGSTGVYGTGNNYGVVGVGSSGIGVYGSGTTGLYGSGGTYGARAYGVTGVYGSGSSYGLHGTGVTGVYATGTSYGVYATGTSYGVYGSGITGVYGSSSRGSGVYGYSSETNSSSAVHGYGGQYGVRGVNGRSGGVRGDASYVGIWGEGGVYGANVVATNTSGLNYGIVAATNSPDGYAGYFSGRVHVSGTLSKSAGSFKIDHPLDPANKYLSHSFVESPDMMNIYNGNATLGAKGEALITMPDWFEALNMEFRYQLTCIGGYAPVYIAQEISKNQFKIGGGKPGLKVSWQVTGVRQDAYAKAHRIPLEEDKPAAERGRLLNPEVFGKPATQSMIHTHAPKAARDQAPLQSMPEVPKPPTPERVKPIDPESRR